MIGVVRGNEFYWKFLLNLQQSFSLLTLFQGLLWIDNLTVKCNGAPPDFVLALVATPKEQESLGLQPYTTFKLNTGITYFYKDQQINKLKSNKIML